MAITGEIANKVGRFRPSSCIADDVWHSDSPTPAYEWWYFDALSDDGRDVLVIIFLSNFIFSPRYNRMAAESLRRTHLPKQSVRFPAVAFCYYRDGRPLFRALNEFPPDEFQASTTQPECQIGHNNFRLTVAGSELCFELNIETTLRRNKELRAKLAWTIQEGDFFEGEKKALPDTAAHYWNMVAPRCRVTGTIALSESNGKRSFEHDFQGTGYHDHNRDARWMPATIAEWQWGRFHFSAATAVFYRYRERFESRHTTRLYLIQDGSLDTFTPRLTMNAMRQHLFGLRYPRLLQLQSVSERENLSLSIRQQRVIDSSFFYLRFLSQATLATADGCVQQATGFTEHLAPRPLSYSWLHWLINMRIGRNGRGAFLP